MLLKQWMVLALRLRLQQTPPCCGIRAEMALLRAENEELTGRVDILEVLGIGQDGFELVVDEPPDPGRVDRELASSKPGAAGRSKELRLPGSSSRGASTAASAASLPSEVYVVVRDTHGFVHLDPVKVFFSYSEAKIHIMKQQVRWVRLLRVPEWEAKLAVSSAGGLGGADGRKRRISQARGGRSCLRCRSQ